MPLPQDGRSQDTALAENLSSLVPPLWWGLGVIVRLSESARPQPPRAALDQRRLFAGRFRKVGV